MFLDAVSKLWTLFHSFGWQMLRDLQSPKGQGLLRKEGPPTFPIILQLGDHSDPEYRILHHCRLWSLFFEELFSFSFGGMKDGNVSDAFYPADWLWKGYFERSLQKKSSFGGCGRWGEFGRGCLPHVTARYGWGKGQGDISTDPAEVFEGILYQYNFYIFWVGMGWGIAHVAQKGPKYP